MALGDIHSRLIAAGGTYTPASAIKELVMNISIDDSAMLMMEYSGETGDIDISPTSGQTSMNQQEPGYVLTSSVTLTSTGGVARINTVEVS